MIDLRQQIERCSKERVCWMGLGNEAAGDDGFGMLLAQDLVNAGQSNVIFAGTEPERALATAALGGCQHLVFLDAVDVGAAPGSAVWLDGGAMVERFPQLSTHRISLGLLARWVESSGNIRVWLLGVQPRSIRPALQLSPEVESTRAILREWLLESCAGSAVR